MISSCGDGLYGGTGQYHRAASDRRARRGFPVPQLAQFLADDDQCGADQHSLFIGEFAQCGWVIYPPLS